ncbi:MAG: OmpA family protein, partial [Bacteroidota bacterium]
FFHFCLLLLLSSFCNNGFAQNYVTKKTVKGKALDAYKQGMKHNMREENDKAIKEFEKALRKEPLFIDAQLQWAAVHYAKKDYTTSEKGFEKVLQLDTFYNKKVLYTLALAEMKQQKYEEAAVHFKQYISTQPKNETLRKRADYYLDVCEFKAYTFINPVPFEPKSLGDQINTPDWEYLPSLTADGNTLVYTVQKNSWEDFYISRKVDGVWQKGEPIEAINTELNEGAQSISADGKFLVFTACDRKDGYGKCDLYFSEVIDGRWTKPANMGKVINSAASEKQPSISADGKVLYFASDRKGGKGGYDLWLSRRSVDGRWSQPLNMGAPINSKEHDNTPFIHADGATLYFMSKGHVGMGGFDLFYARANADGTWGKPINLGHPINTPSNESAMVVSIDGKTAYFSTDRQYGEEQMQNAKEEQKRTRTTDLYSFELYKKARPQVVTYVKARVTDAQTGKKLSAKVDFVDLSNGHIQASSMTDRDGEFLICLPMGKNYALNVSKEQYLFYSENFALAEKGSLEKPYILEIALQAIPKIAEGPPDVSNSKPIILKNVFFNTGSAELGKASYVELSRLKLLLDDHPGLRIQINGHTDNVGSEEDNLQLSEPTLSV